MAHVTEQAIKAWQAGWQDAADDLNRKRLPPGNIGKHPSAYILGYFASRESAAVYGMRADNVYYNDYLATFMENYDL